MAIPLIALVGLLAYVAGTSINNAISLDRVPNLINASGIPAAKFGVFVESERTAAVVYLFDPTAANLAAYRTAITATDKAEPAFTAAMTAPAVVGTESSGGATQIQDIFGGLRQLPTLRSAVQARVISPLAALAAYSQGPAATTKLFLIQTDSVAPTDQLGPAVGLIATVQAREQLSQEYALLAGMLAGRKATLADRVAFTNMAAARQANLQDADNLLGPADLAAYNAPKAGSGAMQQDLTNIEQAIAAGTPVRKLPVTAAQWQATAGTLLTDYFNGGVAVANAILVADHQNSHQAWVRVAVTSGIALLGLLITILFSVLVGRSIIRRLGGLERSARTLAEDQLPDVIARLRRGEDVDVAAEAPALRTGGDEIGRVGQAFELVRQTAVRSAVEESKLRQGLNDVFRSLARRSQSLLHRQLTLLDQMERRATDPEALDDLFRLDHLTTRMRRHAEGLVILAGAPPGRSWSSPVRMVDVMRGAIAEVEDYARVSVATRSQAALAGSAVADVIHLLAELIENATTLSPPYTSVRVSGDTVANGFAIEVEDRGLGMSPQRLAELNERLASPPEFNPSDSEQLGLFVVSQLAKRHGIRVTLKASPYGGTAAIVLIPHHLVVTEEAFRAGLPGTGLPGVALPGVALPGVARPGEPAAIGMAEPAANGHHAAPELAGVRISGPLRRSPGGMPEDITRGPYATAPHSDAAGPEPANGAAEHPDFDAFAPRRHGADGGPVPANGGSAPYLGAAPYADPQAPFPGWTGRSVAGGSVTPAAPAAPGPGTARAPGVARGPGGPGAAAGPAGPATPMTPMASPRRGRASGPPWELSRQTGPLPAIRDDGDQGAQADGPDGDAPGLPRRVRQASLAPQLRDNPPRRPTSAAVSAAPASGPTPAEIRQTMSALQRGWQEGRSQRMPAPGDSPFGPPGPGPYPDGGQGPAADQSRGESDGT
ncbi:MAG TPA: nitrate- and nitrite sensing domain-containing protein [Streptosporangiaceae bacterium]